MCATCAPGDQGKSGFSQCEQVRPSVGQTGIADRINALGHEPQTLRRSHQLGRGQTFILLLGSGTRHAIGRFEPKVFGLLGRLGRSASDPRRKRPGRYRPQSIPLNEVKAKWLANCEAEVNASQPRQRARRS